MTSTIRRLLLWTRGSDGGSSVREQAVTALLGLLAFALLSQASIPGLIAADPLVGTTLAVANPGFEADTYTERPGYWWMPGNGPITGWNFGYGTWAVGINPVFLDGDPDSPISDFADNGVIPEGTQVAFVQHRGSTLCQKVEGFVPGRSYVVRFWANARLWRHPDEPDSRPELKVHLGATLLFSQVLQAVGYQQFTTEPFIARAGSYEVAFTNDAPGDTTALIDFVEIVDVGPAEDDETRLTIVNPGFEADTFTEWPGYWFQEANGPITGWSITGNWAAGINPVFVDGIPDSPFANNGFTPEGAQVAFIQGNGTLQQKVEGFAPGRRYVVRFWANIRAVPGETETTLQVHLGAALLSSQIVQAVGYQHFTTEAFVARAGSYQVAFTNDGPGEALIDFIEIVDVGPAGDDQPRLDVVNPGFEADTFTDWPGYWGWPGNGEITGWNVLSEAPPIGINPVFLDGSPDYPLADNGFIPEGGQVAFIQGVGTLSGTLWQKVNGFEPGRSYVVRFWTNVRAWPGDTEAALQVHLGGAALFSQVLEAVGYRQFTTKALVARAASNQIAFTNDGPGDALIDFVEIVDVGPGADADGDGVADGDDNCEEFPNPDQSDQDGDGIGDACQGIFNVNPHGWIQTHGWNFLMPLLNDYGCTGGREAKMLESWVAPHVIGDEDPKDGDAWDDIDFGGAARSGGWGGSEIFGAPTWFSNRSLGVELGVWIPGDDIVDFQVMADILGWWSAPIASDNVLGIATTYVRNNTGAHLPVEICDASDESIQVWVNNQLTGNKSLCRAIAPQVCSEGWPAILPPGISKIGVLVWEGEGPWGFRLGIARPGGGSLYTDADAGELEFLGTGAGDDAIVGQPQYLITRSASGLPCPLDAYGIALAGAGPGTDPVTVTERILADSPADLQITEAGSGTIEDIQIPDLRPVGEFDDHRLVGYAAPCSTLNETTFDGTTYSSLSTNGGEVWADGDSLEFAYKSIEGDFDMAIFITGKSHSTEVGRWGKFGLMARWSLDNDARYTAIQDHLPLTEADDTGRISRRFVHHEVQLVEEPVLTEWYLDPNLSSGYIDIGASPSLKVESAPFSLEAWLLPTGDIEQGMMVLCSSPLGVVGYYLMINSGGHNIDLAKAGITGQPVDCEFLPDTWYHIAAVQHFEGSSPSYVEYFVNGELIGSFHDSSDYIPSTGENQSIAGAFGDTHRFGGVIDEVAVYGRALDPAEILQHYQDGLGGQGYCPQGACPPGLISYWKFDEGGGTTTYDSVGRNHGSIIPAGTPPVWTAGRVDGALLFSGGTPGTDGSSLKHPLCMRLTRRGNLVEAWVSNTAGTPGYDPADDANWALAYEDDWGPTAPSRLFVGFANSNPPTAGCAEQRVDFVLTRNVGAPGSLAIGKSITWNVNRGTLDPPGLSYQLKYIDQREIDFQGDGGESVMQGLRRLYHDLPTPYVGPNGNTYDIVWVRGGITWPDALAAAEARMISGRPGHLATITSFEEDEFLEALRQEVLPYRGIYNPSVWAGGFQLPDSDEPYGGWTWVNDEGPFPGLNGEEAYANWLPEEPNDWFGLHSENYLTFGGGDCLGWNDDGYPGADPVRAYAVEYEKLAVAIDIKPGSPDNPINLKGKGVIPVAVLSSATFDATTVDPSTVRFGPTGSEAPALRCATDEDADLDGLLDMVCQFDTREARIACGDRSATLWARDNCGYPLQGSDSIRTLGCPDSSLGTGGLEDDGSAVRFIRGDANADGLADLSDAIFSLSHQFLGGRRPSCMKAADANGDGLLDVADPIYLLTYLYQGTRGPPAPYPGCGLDGAASALSCEGHPPCQ